MKRMYMYLLFDIAEYNLARDGKKWISCSRPQYLTGWCSRCLESFLEGERKHRNNIYILLFVTLLFLFRVRVNVE